MTERRERKPAFLDCARAAMTRGPGRLCGDPALKVTGWSERRREVDRRSITCQIFIEERDDGTVWAPYKTLIGYRVGNRVFIRSYGEQIYSNEEFPNKDEAVDSAKMNAWETVRSKFHGVGKDDIDWDIRQESAPVFAGA